MKASEAVAKYSLMSPSVARLIERLKKDPEAVKITQEAGGKYGIEFLMKLLPFLVKGDEVYEMVGFYVGKQTQEIKDEEFKEFTDQLKSMMTDSNLVSFIKASN
jgi:hypothetical protein